MRTCYLCLLWLHPPAFRREFGGEMLWIFDQSADSQGSLALFGDGFVSLARQWTLRTGWWKIALAVALAMVQVVFVLMFGRLRVAEHTPNMVNGGFGSFTMEGPLARQPMTTPLVMYLAVMVTGALLIMVIGLVFWQNSFAGRRRGR